MGGLGRHAGGGARGGAGLEVNGAEPDHGGAVAAGDEPCRVAAVAYGATAAGSGHAASLGTRTRWLRVLGGGGVEGIRARGWARRRSAVAGWTRRRSAVAGWARRRSCLVSMAEECGEREIP
jgi:hypothetical protein